jgi:hypothetical protein
MKSGELDVSHVNRYHTVLLVLPASAIVTRINGGDDKKSGGATQRAVRNICHIYTANNG